MSALREALQQRLSPPPAPEPRPVPERSSMGQAHGNEYRIVVRGTRRYRVGPDGREKFVGHRPKGA